MGDGQAGAVVAAGLVGAPEGVGLDDLTALVPRALPGVAAQAVRALDEPDDRDGRVDGRSEGDAHAALLVVVVVDMGEH